MIAYESNSDNLRVEWNGSATYNVFYGQKNVNCFTNYETKNAKHAARIARQWIIDNRWNGIF
jgi:hypothetical protein